MMDALCYFAAAPSCFLIGTSIVAKCSIIVLVSTYLIISTPLLLNKLIFTQFVIGLLDISRHSAADLIRAHIMNFETLLEDEENQIRGFTYIFDFKEVSIPYISVWTPTQFHKAVSQGEV
jgi:hypothetical protein